MTRASILLLPTEVINQILDYVIPITRLALHGFLDAEWKYECAEPRSVPSLLFVNKQLSAQAGNILYAKAILELTPVKPPGYILNALERPDTSLDLTASLDIAFSSIPAHSLARIRKVFVYSGQRDAVSAEGYEATIRWLIEKTDVKSVYLSQRLMTRLRKFPVNIDCAINFMDDIDSLTPIRTVEVYAIHARSYWEQTRMGQLTKAIQGNPPPPCQYFLTWPLGPILLDPRWDARISDNDPLRQKRDKVAAFLDALAASTAAQLPGDTNCTLLNTGGETHWLYQKCFVLSS